MDPHQTEIRPPKSSRTLLIFYGVRMDPKSVEGSSMARGWIISKVSMMSLRRGLNRGKTAVRVLQGPGYAKVKNVEKVTSEDEATQMMIKILPKWVPLILHHTLPTTHVPSVAYNSAFFLKVDRPPDQKATTKTLLITPQQSFDPLSYYAWFYDGSPLYTYLGGAAMVVIIFAGVLFPLWPIQLRIGVWYLSMLGVGLFGALMVLAVIRLVFWLVTVMCMKRAIWIFPNLFADVGVVSDVRRRLKSDRIVHTDLGVR